MTEPTALILDTHVWVWLVSGEDSLALSARQAVEEAVVHGLVFVPIMSVWEISMLEVKGRISLTKSVQEWVDDALQLTGFKLAPLTPKICIESTRLPGELHGDPMDRLIIATARVEGCKIVSRDARILSYANQGHVKALLA